MSLTTRSDQVAEQLERGGYEALATVIDDVSQELEQRSATASFPAFKTPEDPAAMLTGSANRLLEATRQYGAKSCRIDGKVVELALDRGDVETTAALEFCSQDEAGNPQLRFTFRCGDERMVRWAAISNFDFSAGLSSALVDATKHVFGTGENYGANVVTAAAVTKPSSCLPAHRRRVRAAVDGEALRVCRAVNDLIGEVAMSAAAALLEAKVSGEPYQRALDRIKSLQERGVDVEKHTLLRLGRTGNIDKIEGLYQAAMHAGLGRVASEAKKKFRKLTGQNPERW